MLNICSRPNLSLLDRNNKDEEPYLNNKPVCKTNSNSTTKSTGQLTGECKIKGNIKTNEYDLKKDEIEEIETTANIVIMKNLGVGGFSTVKLIYNNNLNKEFAMKVVSVFVNHEDKFEKQKV